MTHRSLTIRAKLTLAFGILAALVAVVAALALKDLGDANARFVHHVDGVSARATVASHLRIAVDRRAIAARNLVLVSTPADLAAEDEEVKAAHAEVQRRLAQLKAMVATSGVSEAARQHVAAIDQVEQRYGPVALAIVDLALKGEHDAAIAKMNTECRPLIKALAKATTDYADYTESRAAQLKEEAQVQYGQQRILLIAACLLALGAAVLGGWLIVRSLRKALGAEPADLSRVASRVAEGNLTDLDGAHEAPQGSVLASLGAMQGSLSRIVNEVRRAADSIATGTEQIAHGGADLSARTELQASAIQQTAATMDQLGSTVRSNAENAQQANVLAQGASDVAGRGGAVVGQVVDTMRGINASSKRIADIITVIDGIAFQTNILALNAAVEAARAGEQGRGFAVVASEVRALAQRSASAAKEIKTLITTSVEQVEQGSALVDRAGETMSEIVGAIQRVSHIVGEITLATAEQSSGVAQVGQAVAQLDESTQQNAALAEESAAAASSLREQSEHLVGAMSTFKLAAS